MNATITISTGKKVLWQVLHTADLFLRNPIKDKISNIFNTTQFILLLWMYDKI